MKVIQLTLPDFVNRISRSQNLVHVENGFGRKCKIVKCHYGGARTDRLGGRNRLTNALGFKKCAGREFLSAEDLDESGGIFLADILVGYGDDEFFIESGEAISFSCDSFQGGGCGYGDISSKQHLKSVKKPKIKD